MTKPLVGSIVAVLACASAAAYLWQELAESREEIATLRAQLAEMERQSAMHALARDAARAGEALARTQPEPADLDQSERAAPPPTGVAFAPAAAPNAIVGAGGLVRSAQIDPDIRRRLIEVRDQQVRMLEDPEYRELMHAQQKLSLQQAYADLDLFLDLTPQEYERLLDTLAEQALRNMEQLPMVLPSDGTPPSEQDLRARQQAFETQRRNNEAEIAAVLGPKYEDWQAYQKSGWARAQVNRLRQSLAMTSEPLREDQLKPLVEAIAREQERMNQQAHLSPGAVPSLAPGVTMDPRAMSRAAEDWLERTRESHQRIRDAVSSYLTPAQFEQLQRFQEQEIKMQELAVRQSRARMEAQARGELSPDAPIGIIAPATRVISSN